MKRKSNFHTKTKNETNTSKVYFRDSPKVVDQFDVEVEGVPYRVFITENDQIYCNEIVSMNYHGSVLLRNPAYDEKKAREILKLFFDGSTPKNQLKNTASIINKSIAKRIQKLFEKEKVPASPVGNPGKKGFAEATVFAITKENSKISQKQAIELAYVKYPNLSPTKDSFVRNLQRRRSKLKQLYQKSIYSNKQEYPNFTFKKFAKFQLKPSRSPVKQAVKK